MSTRAGAKKQANVRREEVCKGLPRLDMTNQERRNLVVEKRAGNAAVSVRDVQTSGIVFGGTLVEVPLEVRGAVLVSTDLQTPRS